MHIKGGGVAQFTIFLPQVQVALVIMGRQFGKSVLDVKKVPTNKILLILDLNLTPFLCP